MDLTLTSHVQNTLTNSFYFSNTSDKDTMEGREKEGERRGERHRQREREREREREVFKKWVNKKRTIASFRPNIAAATKYLYAQVKSVWTLSENVI